jgi:uncharacterized protein with beta-barrel porin domain
MRIPVIVLATVRHASPARVARQWLLACCCVLPAAVTTAQPLSLDAAVNRQLGNTGVTPCGLLLNGADPSDQALFARGLREICTRAFPDAGASSSSGGGAGTATSTPEAVRRRLEGDETLVSEPVVRGVFVTASAGVANRDVTTFQDGYQGDVTNLLVGFDREFDAWVAGFTVEYSALGGQFTAGGDFDTTSLGPTAFAGRSFGDLADLNIYVGTNSPSNERLRVANFTQLRGNGFVYFDRDGRPRADFDAQETLGGFQLAFRLTANNLTFRPMLAIDWRQTDFDAYSETEDVDSGLALFFYDDERTSLISTLGLDVSAAISTEFGAVVLGGQLNLKHEHDDEQRTVFVSFIDDLRPAATRSKFGFATEPPDTSYMELGVNAMVLLQGGFQAFVAYEQVAAHRFQDTRVFSGGFRKEF